MNVETEAQRLCSAVLNDPVQLGELISAVVSELKRGGTLHAFEDSCRTALRQSRATGRLSSSRPSVPDELELRQQRAAVTREVEQAVAGYHFLDRRIGAIIESTWIREQVDRSVHRAAKDMFPDAFAQHRSDDEEQDSYERRRRQRRPREATPPPPAQPEPPAPPEQPSAYNGAALYDPFAMLAAASSLGPPPNVAFPSRAEATVPDEMAAIQRADDGDEETLAPGKKRFRASGTEWNA